MFVPFILANVGGVVKGAEDGARLAFEAFKEDWTAFAAGSSPIYIAIVSVSMLVAVVLVAFWSLGWYRQISEEGFSTNVISEMIFPLLIIMLLSNNGKMMAALTVGLNNTTVTLNSRILFITKNGVTLRDAIRISNADQGFILAAQIAIAECEKRPTSQTDAEGNKTNPRQECIDKTIEDAKAQALKNREDKNLNGNAANFEWNFLKSGGEIINAAVQGTIFFILSGLSLGFAYVVQLSFLLIAHVAPIFLVLSLLPASPKPFYAWLSGWLALTLVLISNSIIVGIVASSIVNQPSTSLLLMQLIQAIFSPLLAMAIGTGGGMAVFTAFTNGISFVASSTVSVIGRIRGG